MPQELYVVWDLDDYHMAPIAPSKQTCYLAVGLVRKQSGMESSSDHESKYTGTH